MIVLWFLACVRTAPEGACLPGAPIGPDTPRWYADADQDGAGDPAVSTQACDPPSGTVADDGDCDDTDPAVHAGASEVCDGIDQDCDGVADDDATDAPTWHADADRDGFGASGGGAACTAPVGSVADSSDCDDADPEVSPAASEVCDGIDDDCDGLVDDADDPVAETSTFYADGDGDGFGDPLTEVEACAEADGWTADDTDCDDTDPAVFPGADERCDGRDGDCDGHVDADAVDATAWHPDADGDGLGSSLYTLLACDAPAGFVADDTDCDDGDAAVFPGAVEVCDDIDGDCDGTVDEDAVDAGAWYADDDRDGYADPDVSVVTCDRPTGWLLAEDALDCDDADAAVNPDGVETCDDGVDQDCDGHERPCPLGAPVLVGDGVGDVWYGEDFGVRAGQAVAWADTDADGLDEAIVGVYQDSSEAAFGGAIYGIRSTGTGQRSLADAEVRIYGAVADDYVGGAVADAGDVDGDGYGDVLVGAHHSSAVEPDGGAVFLLPGPLVSMSLDDAITTLFGEESSGEAGWSVAGLGDLDADGFADIAVCAPGVDRGDQEGETYLLHGPLTGEVLLSSADSIALGAASAHLGSVAGGQDIDGDGLPDVLIGGPRYDGETGLAWLLTTIPTGDIDLDAAEARFSGVDTEDRAGAALALPGDVDADGYGDLLLGAPGESTTGPDGGAAYLVLGPVAGDFDLSWADAIFLADAAGDATGTAVAGAGDVDGDERADLLVGSPGDDQLGITNGAVSVLLGPLAGTASIGDASYATILPYTDVTEAGTSLGGTGDIDGDGVPDFLIGGPDFGDVMGGAGGAFLLLGADL